MISLWTVVPSVLTILLTCNLCAKRLGRRVIQFDPKRAIPARQAALHLALRLEIRPHSTHALRKKQILQNSPTEVLQWRIMTS